MKETEFWKWTDLCGKHKTLPATQEDEISDLFKYFIGRDNLLLLSKVLHYDGNIHVDSENEDP